MDIETETDMALDMIQAFNVRFKAKEASWLMRAVAVLLRPFTPRFMTHFWTTLRCTIYHPGPRPKKGYSRNWIKANLGIVHHELEHVLQWKRWWLGQWLLFIFPLPILLNGRWFIERGPYLADIRRGRMTVGQAVHLLWYNYGWPWPPRWMRAWFEEQLSDSDLSKKSCV